MEACRVEPVSAEELDRRGESSAYSPFSHWRHHIYGTPKEGTSYFVFDLWSAQNSGQEKRYAYFDDIETWLTEHTTNHRILVLNFSVRLIAILDRDEAFLFAMRFR